MTAQHAHQGEIPSVVLSNDAIEVVVLAGKGADILSITDHSSGVSPLWRSRWSHHHARSAEAHGDSTTAWLMACVGGWNFLFPGGGAESTVSGGLQPMHGEASIVPWDVVDLDGSDTLGAYVRLRTHLGRSPFTLDRTIRLIGDSGALEVTDCATNEGGEPFPVTWTQHPTLGAPFLDSSCRVETNADWVEPDDTYALPHVPIPIGERRAWRDVAGVLDVIPGRGEPRQLLSYLHFTEPHAWYRVTNAARNLAFQVDWALEDYAFAWYFQEMDATAGWPWFSNTYIMAIEPSTTWPGRGLAYAGDVARVDVVQPGESKVKTIRASFGSVA